MERRNPDGSVHNDHNGTRSDCTQTQARGCSRLALEHTRPYVQCGHRLPQQEHAPLMGQGGLS